MRVETCLIGQQAHTQRASVLGSKSGKFREVVILQHIDAGRDLSIAVVPKTLTGDGFVVAGQLGNQTSVIRPEFHPGGHHICDRAADGVDAGGPVGINGVGHKDDIGIAGRVHPDGGSSEPGMTE